MALNVGELEAVLRAKDELTPVLAKAEKALADLEKSTKAPDKAMGGLSTSIGEVGRMFGVTLSAGAIIGFGKEVIAQAANVKDLSDRLDISTTSVQQFGHAAEMGGGQISDVGISLQYMQKVIAGGGGDVITALNDMGLDLTAIQKMGADQMFRTIADAAGAMPNPVRQTDAAMTLLGRNAGVFLPSIRDGFSGVANAATTMSEQTVLALDRVDKIGSRVWQGIKVGGAEAILATLNAFNTTMPGIVDLIEGGEAKTQHFGDTNLAVAKQSQEALAILRSGWAEVVTATAQASAEGLAQREAVAKAMHEIELREINESILSSEQKNARLTAAEQKYAADLIRIHADTALAVRDIEERSATAITQRKAEQLAAEEALEVSAASLSRGTAESIAAAKMAIVTKYAGEEYSAKVEALDRLEQAEALQADREISDATAKAAALLAIHKDYEQQRLILATTSQATLNDQVQKLEADHLARMAQMGMTSIAQPDQSTLTPQQAAATAQHQAALGGLEAAQKQALSLGNTDQAQQLQQLIDEEGAAFVRAMQDGGVAATGLTTAATTATEALHQVAAAATAAAVAYTVTSGQRSTDLFNSASGDRSAGEIYNDAIGNIGGVRVGSFEDTSKYFKPRAKGGPVSAGQSYLVGEEGPELFFPGTSGSISPNSAGAGITVNNNFSGVLLSDDPMGRAAMQAAVEEAVMRALNAAQKNGTRG